MIEVSEKAASALLQSLQATGTGPEQGLRLKERESGFSLELDSPTEQDRVIQHNESTLLIIDKEFEERVGDAVIDVQEGPSGPQLTIQRVSPDEQG